MIYLVYLSFISIMLQWPNMIFNYSNETIILLKNPLLIISSVALLWLGVSNVLKYWTLGILMLLISINYCIINEIYFHSYVFKTIYFILLVSTFSAFPVLIHKYLKTIIYVG